jgi:CubicO group peptidase (beta-lactamase class C family)
MIFQFVCLFVCLFVFFVYLFSTFITQIRFPNIGPNLHHMEKVIIKILSNESSNMSTSNKYKIDKITVTQLLTHRAGLPFFDTQVTVEMLERATAGDRSLLSEFLARQKQVWKNGELGYHAHSVGLFAAELVFRIDPKHRPLHRFWKEEFGEKYGIDYHLVLNFSLEKRILRLTYMQPSSATEEIKNEQIDPEVQEWQSKTYTVIENYSPYKMRFLECPSSVGYGNSKSLAQIYGSMASKKGLVDDLNAKNDDKPLLSKSAIEQLTTVEFEDFDIIDRSHQAFSKGGLKRYHLPETGRIETRIIPQNQWKHQHKHEQYGHGGFGGSLGFADLKNELGFGYATRTLANIDDDPRRMTILNALYSCISLQSKL